MFQEEFMFFKKMNHKKIELKGIYLFQVLFLCPSQKKQIIRSD